MNQHPTKADTDDYIHLQTQNYELSHALLVDPDQFMRGLNKYNARAVQKPHNAAS